MVKTGPFLLHYSGEVNAGPPARRVGERRFGDRPRDRRADNPDVRAHLTLVSRLTAALLTLAGATACASGTGIAARPAPFPGTAAGRTTVHAVSPGPSAIVPTTIEAAVDTALALRGTAYVLGGADPAVGFDCSGLVQYALGQHGIALPRTVAEQWRLGRPIALADVRPGDLLFFVTDGSGPSHVGLAIAADTPAAFVHAPGSGGVVRVERADSPYWRTRFLEARRLW